MATPAANRRGVRVAVVGDPGTGKSSLVVALAAGQFPETAPPRVVPPARLPDDFFPECIPVTVVDTSSSAGRAAYLVAECQAADAVVLTYACDRPETLERLSSYWLPKLRRVQVKVPVIVVGCKLDLKDEQLGDLSQAMEPIMQGFREVETCIECCALLQIQRRWKDSKKCIPVLYFWSQRCWKDCTSTIIPWKKLKETRKKLVLREIPEDDVNSLLSNKESLAPCGVAAFVYDSCDEHSWQRAKDMLVQVATHGENNCYSVPCLLVASKDDLARSPLALQESIRKIVHAAQKPHLSIPETQAAKARRRYHQHLNRSLMVVSVRAVAVVGIAACRIYAAQKNTYSC